MSEAARNRSPETRAKNSEAHRGKRHSPETRAKMSDVARGKPKSAEHRQHIAEAMRGKHPSAETRGKMSAAQQKRFADPVNHPLYGKCHTIETRAKISESRRGKCRGSDNHMYGKHHTAATKRKISEALQGKRRGANNSHWKGGPIPYNLLWPEQRIRARNRDNYTCQLCGITEEELGEQMSVHRIRPFRESADNSLSNLVCLCGNHSGNNCHIRCEHHPEVCPEPRKHWLLTEGLSGVSELQMS